MIGPWGAAATPAGDDAVAAGHSWRCDFVQMPEAADKECYCPTAEERAEQLRYERRVEEDGEPPEPYWVTL